MSVQYTPLTQADLDIIGLLEGFSVPEWTGPALPRPEGAAGFDEIVDTLDKLIARGQYLIQAKDGLSIQFTLNHITATAERFMLGTESQVQLAGDLRGLLTLIESFLGKVSAASLDANRVDSAFSRLRAKVDAWLEFRSRSVSAASYADGRTQRSRRLFGVRNGRAQPVFHGLDHFRGRFSQRVPTHCGI